MGDTVIEWLSTTKGAQQGLIIGTFTIDYNKIKNLGIGVSSIMQTTLY